MVAISSAWSKLGANVATARDSASMIVSSGLDWRVEKRPLRTVDGREVPDHYATVRTDTGEILGVVGDRYQIVQNADAFSFLDSLLKDGILKYESAGFFKGGRIVWMLARMPSVDEIAPGDVTHRYALFSTSHDGSLANHALPTSVRPICMNTLKLALKGDVGFKHTGDVDAKLNQARLYLSQFDEQFTLFRDHARLLAQSKCTLDQRREYIATLFPEIREEGRARTIRANKLDQISRNYTNERNSLPSIKGTWWQILNAVTESVDHDSRRVLKTREHHENRMLSTLEGNGADFKRRAFELAINMAS